MNILECCTFLSQETMLGKVSSIFWNVEYEQCARMKSTIQANLLAYSSLSTSIIACKQEVRFTNMQRNSTIALLYPLNGSCKNVTILIM